MMEQHKQTPWMIGAFESGMVAINSSDDQEVTGFIDPEDASRILACVNACAGFSTNELEEVSKHGGFIDQTRYNTKVTKQRDELLAFAEEARRSGDTRLASMAIATIAIVRGAA